MDPLVSVLVTLGDGGRVASVRELLEGWAAHVRRLNEEHVHRSSELTSAWGIHDYYAALIIRSQVEEALASVPAKYQLLVCDELAIIDEEFCSFTRVDEDGELDRFLNRTYNESRSDGWWWLQIPITGPVREELAIILTSYQQDDDGLSTRAEP